MSRENKKNRLIRVQLLLCSCCTTLPVLDVGHGGARDAAPLPRRLCGTPQPCAAPHDSMQTRG